MILYRITRYYPNGKIVWQRYKDKKHSFHSAVGSMFSYYGWYGKITLEAITIHEDDIELLAVEERKPKLDEQTLPAE